MPVRVASICPVRRHLSKPLFQPQKYWWTPPVFKGQPPFVIQFNDNILQPNSYRAFGVYGDDPILAEHVANDFIQSNMGLPFSHPPDMMPGLWVIGSLGQNEQFRVLGGANAGATILQLDHAHRMNGPGELTISGAVGFWAVMNGIWIASPMNETQISIPVDSRAFGDFSNGGIMGLVSIKRDLTLDQEAEIMRPRQDKWLARCLQDARWLWNRERSTNHIREIHHIAAAHFGIEGEEWQTVMDSDTSMECRYCKKRIPTDAATCAYCQNIANPTVHAKLKLEEEQALKTEKKKLKDAQDEIDRKLREMNRAAEARESAEAMTEEATIG